MLTIFVRSVLLFVAAVVAMRVMGKRQVGQLQPYELVVVIMIAELAATPMGSLGIPLLDGLLPMAALIVCHGIFSALCMRSERFRRLIDGQPTVLMRNGVVCEKQLRKSSVALTDLLEAMRIGGVQDISEAGTVVLETSGQVSVFPKAEHRPLTPADMGKQPEREGLPLPLILDGKIQGENLRRGGWEESWLQRQLKNLGFEHADRVLFLCVNPSGLMICQGKGETEIRQQHVRIEKEW